MSTRSQTPVAVAEQAVHLAEDALTGLPMSAHVRDLQRRVAALKSLFHGGVIALLTRQQHFRLAADAVALAREALDGRRRATG